MTTLVTAAELTRLRRMIVDTAAPQTYSDGVLTTIIERYPCVDMRGESPWVESTVTPGTLVLNDDWTATYDINAAAGEVWEEKAAALAANFDFSADGAGFQRSQAFTQAQQMARTYPSRRNPSTVTLRPEPRPDADDLLELAEV
jgi:hypothetical protein